MKVLVVGGTGFIGRRLVPLLAAQGAEVVAMDIAPETADFADMAETRKGDVTQFDQVMALVAETKPDRLVNLAYFIGELPPRIALKLDILGMGNCFEAARLGGVAHTVYASSLAVSGQQSHFGERAANEDDHRYGDNQYAMHKIFNEWQARDYTEKYGMAITGIRPANVTGPDKIYGSIDHVRCVTFPARGEPVSFPHADAMRAPVHVDDVAEAFARVTLAEEPRHPLYNTGGHAISMGELAALVREFLPDADISFENETGGLAASGNFRIDNSRLVEEFGLQYAPFRDRVRQIIEAVQAEG